MMLLFRRVLQSLFAAWIGAWIARALFDWLLGLSGGTLLALQLAVAAICAVAAFAESRGLEPWSSEQRAAVVLRTLLVALLVCVGCLLLPAPWSVVAFVAVLLAASGWLWSVRHSTRDPREPRLTR